MAMTRDEWRNYICCVLTVREELVRENRPLVQDLVNHIQAAGSWLDATPANRAPRPPRSHPAASSSTRIRTSSNS
ncbi:ABC transporter substrate-binding protein [Pseudoduganella sp. UC29_106]|uniref:ABC transporter substrate-binding protein n=1 Tax=Pseudoduganella sp. UC29_106 TaxID=3374553 RepID=UPI003756E7A7